MAMFDVDFGRDDGIKCSCGGKTFLVDDQGYGLRGYECEDCGGWFQVQLEWNDYDGEPDDYYEPPLEAIEDGEESE